MRLIVALAMLIISTAATPITVSNNSAQVSVSASDNLCWKGRLSKGACPIKWISTPTCPNGQVGVSYSCCISVSNFSGETDVSFSADSSLPAGLAFSNECIVGTPTGAASFSDTITATDTGATRNATTSSNVAFDITGGSSGTLVSSLTPTVQGYEYAADTDIDITFSTNVYKASLADGSIGIWPASGSIVTMNSITAEVTYGGSTYSANVSAVINPTEPACNTCTQGLLNASNGWGNYSSALDIAANLPWPTEATDAISSVVIGVQKPEASLGLTCGTDNTETKCLIAVYKFTIFNSEPSSISTMLKPASVGTSASKTIYRTTDFDLTRITSRERADITATTADMTEAANRWRCSIEFMRAELPLEVSRGFRPDACINEYGAQAYDEFFDGALFKFFSDDLALAEKQEAIYATISRGIEDYHAFYDPTTKMASAYGGAGQTIGVSQPAFWMASLSTSTADDTVLAALNSTPDDTTITPQEIAQVQIRSPGTTPVWGDLVPPAINYYWGPIFARQCYEGATGNCTNSGKRTVRDPHGYIDGPENGPGLSYMSVTFPNYQRIAMMMEIMSEYCGVVNKSELVTYVKDRAANGVQAAPDPCAPPDPRELGAYTVPTGPCDPYSSPENCTYYSLSGNTTNLTYGPDPYDTSQCIGNSMTCTDTGSALSCTPASPGDANYGQSGRYTSYDGNSVTQVTGSTLTLFNTLIATQDCN